mmetsp:Transcript_10358/g.27274  ORF Transcript_10358/g.27274 Transcript_10358/m.27274 type:complete len:253 (+) Transcript_10358:435-1193(+)
MHVTMCVYHVRSQKGHQKFIRRFMLLTAPKLVPGRDSEGALRSMSMEPRPWITWSCTFGCRVRELCPRGRLSPGAVLVLLPRNSRRSFARSRESSRSSFSRSRECSRAWRPLAHTSRRRASFVKWFRAGISGGLSGLGMKRASSSTGSVLSFCLSCFHAMKWPKLCVCSLGAIGFPTASTASPALSSLAKVLGVCRVGVHACVCVGGCWCVVELHDAISSGSTPLRYSPAGAPPCLCHCSCRGLSLNLLAVG